MSTAQQTAGGGAAGSWVGAARRAAVARLWFKVLCFALSGLIFLLDLALPLGVAAAVPHAAVVLLSVAAGETGFTLAVAALASALTAAGAFVMPLEEVAAADLWVVASNRVLSLTTIWAIAILGLLLTAERARRGRADRELHQSLERTRAILETAVDAFVTIDALGTIQSVNRSAERMFGYPAGEMVGRNVNMLMPSPWREEHDRYIGRYLETGEKRIIGIGREVMGQRKDGSTFPIELAVAESMVGRERMFVGSIRDVSERRRLEDQFLQSQKMEAVGRLAGGVAHDFNTLLASILGYCEMLADGLPEDERLGRAAGQIQRSAERGAALTRQLLAFSRPQPRQRQLVDLNAVVEGTRDMLVRLVGEQIEILHELEPDLDLVDTDPAQMEQVLMNLVVNAADAMPRGGRIVVRTANTDGSALPASASGEAVVLEVADNGAGMDEETRRRIFEPFFTTKGKGKGTGLGLSTVYAIVTESGGAVRVVSAPGEGATFTIHLPRAAEQAETVAEAPRPELAATGPAPGGSETILLVEDDEMFRGLLTEVLEGHGYDVIPAASPAEAVNAYRERAEGPGRRLDLLVTDLVMPGRSGYELAQELRRETPGLKVILMSGYSDETLQERVEGEAEADLPILRKPFSTKVFARKVRSELDGRD
ncbi:MAG: PAS domain S-box protein [Thermoanaerobaculia bacterium]